MDKKLTAYALGMLHFNIGEVQMYTDYESPRYAAGYNTARTLEDDNYCEETQTTLIFERAQIWGGENNSIARAVQSRVLDIQAQGTQLERFTVY